MAKHKKGPLGQVQLEVLQYITDHQPTTVGMVAEHFAKSAGKARTTILTVMEKLRGKGYLTRRKRQGTFHYSTRVDKGDLMKGVVDRFVKESLGGSVSPFLAYLAGSSQLSASELSHLKDLVKTLEERRLEE